MKVLLLTPMADGQTGPAIKYAFEQLGHIVNVIDFRKQPKELYNACCEFKPGLIFFTKYKNLYGEIVKVRKEFKDIIIAMWLFDARKNISVWKGLFPTIKLCDYFFNVEYNRINEWKVINSNTYWLPQGLQSEVYKKPEGIITQNDRVAYSCDVSFCGNINSGIHGYRIPYFETIKHMEIDFKHWGQTEKSRIYDEEHNKMVSLSKINLGCSAFPHAGRCVSVRDYKILGAGGFLLELYRDGIEKLFPMNDSDRILDCYESPQQLTDKILYWLEHEQERRQIAERGYKWIYENATYIHRIKMALDCMSEDLRCQ